MNFEKIRFTSETTQRVYNDYIKEIVNLVATLPQTEQLDILMEINSFVYEGMQRSHDQNELSVLQRIIDNFGDLEEVLKPIVAERKLDQATKTFNPIHVFQALLLNIQSGVFFIFISLCYMILGFFGVAILAKLFSPSQIGMYYKSGEYFVLAGVPEGGINEIQYEVLGDWYIPAMTFAMISFYLFITAILKLEKQFRNKKESNTSYHSAPYISLG